MLDTDLVYVSMEDMNRLTDDSGHKTCEMCRFERVKWFEKQEPSIHVTTVTCGSWHTGAVDEDGNLYTWGRGDWGQLGNGSVRSAVVFCGQVIDR
jgi:hypothetical protein